MATRLASILTVFVCVLLAAGCQSNKNKQEVVQKWAAARAAVQGSLAAERFKLGNLEDARKAVDEAIKLDPTNANFRILSARIHMERNQLEQADQELAIARKLAPRRPEADYLGGIIYQRWQKPNLALELYTAAHEKAPGELAYVMARAEMLMQLNKVADAQQLLESKLTYFEYSGPMRDLLGTIYLQQGKKKEATEMFHQATVLSPEDQAIREHLMRAYFASGQYREAIDQIEMMQRTESQQKRADLYMLKGECYLQIDRLREARAALEKALDLNPSSVPALLALTKVAIRLNDADRAQVCIRRALALEPQNAQVHLAAGYVKLQQKQYQEALAAFEKAADLDSKDPVALCMVGLTHERMGKQDVALQWYGKALQLKPDDALAKSLMARTK